MPTGGEVPTRIDLICLTRQQVPFKNIKSQRVNENNVINLEVVKDIENASEIYLVFNIRNYEYRYKIK